MSLRDWIASFPIPATATPATTATATAMGGQVSQPSQLSQSQMSKCERDSSGDDARDAVEERAAIMEYDGGLPRDAAEQLASGTARQGSWRGLALDVGDLRPCLWCRNLTRNGYCMAHWHGDLRGARDWQPMDTGQPRRCIGYSPPADDPDQRPGGERWPELAEWQARIEVNGQ